MEKMKTKKIKLVSSDGQEFEMSKSVALKVKLLKDIIQNQSVIEHGTIKFLDIEGPALGMVVDFVNYHGKHHAESPEVVSEWEAEFVRLAKQLQLRMEVIEAARYFKLYSLLGLVLFD